MKMNWRKQNALCVLLVIIGHILTDSLGSWIWRNIAFMVCGPLTFRLCYLAPQLKLDHETKYISVPFHLRLGAKDQHTVDRVQTEKDEVDPGKLKDTQSCPKEYLIIWFLAFKR